MENICSSRSSGSHPPKLNDVHLKLQDDQIILKHRRDIYVNMHIYINFKVTFIFIRLMRRQIQGDTALICHTTSQGRNKHASGYGILIILLKSVVHLIIKLVCRRCSPMQPEIHAVCLGSRTLHVCWQVNAMVSYRLVTNVAPKSDRASTVTSSVYDPLYNKQSESFT